MVRDPLDRDLEAGLELLALAEIGLHALGQRGAGELDDALIGLTLLALIDGQRELAVAQQIARARAPGAAATRAASNLA